MPALLKRQFIVPATPLLLFGLLNLVDAWSDHYVDEQVPKITSMKSA
jgi:hypothetical protein